MTNNTNKKANKAKFWGNNRLRVLHVDDSKDDRELIKYRMEKLYDDFEIVQADSGHSAISVLERLRVDCVLSDFQMPEMDGLELFKALKEKQYNIPFIFLTGQGNEHLAAEALHVGADDYFTKDVGFAHYDRLINSVKRAIEARLHREERLESEKKLRYRLDFEKLVLDISTRFINLKKEEIDGGIEKALKEFAIFAEVELGYIFQFTDDDKHFYLTHIWEESPSDNTYDNLRGNILTEDNTWLTGKLKKGRNVIISSEDDYEQVSETGKTLLERHDIKSIINIPMKFESRIFGFLGFASLRSHREWTDDEISLLENVSQIATNGLQRKKTAEILQVSERRYRAIFEHSPEAILITDIETRLIVDANENACKLFKMDRTELFNLDSIDLVSKNQPNEITPEQLIAIRQNAQSGGAPFFEINVHDNQGNDIPCEVKVVRMPHAHKNLNFVSVRDISARKRAEKALKESEINMTALYDQAFQFMGILSIEGTLLSANQTALRFLQLRSEEVIGKLFWETPWWKHSRLVQGRLKKAIKRSADGQIDRFESTHIDAGGNLHHIDFSIKPFRDENGTIRYLITEGRDITHSRLIGKDEDQIIDEE